MILTEEQAKKKWCPLVNHNAYLDTIVQVLHRDEGAKCIGSGCMAWRLATGSDGKRGYCGMAGGAQ